MIQSIRAKVMATFVVFSLLVLLFAGLSGVRGAREAERLDAILANNAAIQTAAMEALSEARRGEYYLHKALLLTNPRERDALRLYYSQLQSTTSNFDIFVKALTWGSESEAFKAADAGLTYLQWVRRGWHHKLVIRNVPDEIRQLAGLASMYHAGMSKYASAVIDARGKELRLAAERRTGTAKTVSTQGLADIRQAQHYGELVNETITQLIGATERSVHAMRAEIQQVQRSSRLATGAIGLALLLGFSGAGWFYLDRILVQPLRRLTDGIDEIRQAGLNRELDVTSRDEIGQLGTSFNAMVNELRGASESKEHYLNELQILNHELEDRVSQRTHELETSQSAAIRSADEAEEARRKIESLSRRNELILNSAGEGIYGLDLQGRATFVNPAAASMLGWQVDELVGKEQHAILHHTKADGTPYPSEECPIYTALKDGGVHHVETEVFWRKDGTSFPVDYVSTPIREGGKVVGAVVTFRDISERQELETQLQQAQKLESIGQLAAGIAHEINTPTQFVGDNTRFLQDAFGDLTGFMDKSAALLKAAEAGPVPDELIKEAKAAMADADLDYLNEEIPSAITQSLEGIGRVADIVRAMKEFSHPATEKKAIDLNRAIETTITVARNEWKYVAEMVTDFDTRLPPVPCLGSEFNQVILNMITNAAHAIAAANGDNDEGKGTITITTRHVDDFAEIRITDTGTGIPEEIRKRVFDHFFTTKEVGKGTGQGLSIAHAVIVKKHSGEIDLESEVGQGTTFITRLPLTDPDLSGEIAA